MQCNTKVNKYLKQILHRKNMRKDNDYDFKEICQRNTNKNKYRKEEYRKF